MLKIAIAVTPTTEEENEWLADRYPWFPLMREFRYPTYSVPMSDKDKLKLFMEKQHDNTADVSGRSTGDASNSESVVADGARTTNGKAPA